MAVPLSMQSHVRESGHPCILDPRHQEELVHQMVHPPPLQEEAQGQEQATSPIHQAIHTPEEAAQDPMPQKKEARKKRVSRR